MVELNFVGFLRIFDENNFFLTKFTFKTIMVDKIIIPLNLLRNKCLSIDFVTSDNFICLYIFSKKKCTK